MSIQTLYTAATGMNVPAIPVGHDRQQPGEHGDDGVQGGTGEFRGSLVPPRKRSRAEDSSSQRTPTGIAIGTGSKLTSVQVNFGQGSLQQTNGPLDIAIQGTGFFRVKNPSGQYLYTRTATSRSTPMETWSSARPQRGGCSIHRLLCRSRPPMSTSVPPGW